MGMSVFTYPVEDSQEKERITKLINELAQMCKAAVTISDQLCVRTNNSKLAIILDQLACDDPEEPNDLPGQRRPAARRKGRRGQRQAPTGKNENQDNI